MIRNVFNRSLSPRRRGKLLGYHIARFFVLPLFRVIFRMRVYGLKNIPQTGGALLVCNHMHNADPLLVIAGCSRPVMFMAKKELWKVPVIRTIADIAGAFPVQRGTADREALRIAGQKLKDGLLVAGFPEGTRSTSGLKEPFRGLSLVALHNDAPVIPVGIVGSGDLPGNGGKQQRRNRIWPKVTLVFGEPFHIDRISPDGKRWRAEDHADAMMLEIAKLLPPAYLGIYADRAGETHPSVNRESIKFIEPEPRSLREWFRRSD